MANTPSEQPEREFEDLQLINVLSSSSQVGAATGAAGLLLGSIAGTLRSANPILFSLSSGIQCFGLGAIYTATRHALLSATTAEQPSPHRAPAPARQQTLISALSGSVAGASMAGLVRGRANVIPGAVFWGVSGLVGQEVWNFRDRSGQQQDSMVAGAAGTSRVGDREAEGETREGARQREPFWVRWSPMKALGDDEYEGMLRERLLRLDAEIAVVEEDLERARGAKAGGSGSGKDGMGR